MDKRLKLLEAIGEAIRALPQGNEDSLSEIQVTAWQSPGGQFKAKASATYLTQRGRVDIGVLE